MASLDIPIARAFVPLLQPGRYKGAWGGRGSAKSWCFADLLIDEMVRRPDTRAVCIREIQKSLDQSVKRLLEDRIQHHGVGDRFSILNTHIETHAGGMALFQGMQNHTAESIKSLEGFRIGWVEEAQSLSQRSLDLLRPTIRREDSELWFSWNPRLPTDPVDALLRGPSPPPGAIVVKATHEDNPWLPDVLRKEMEWDRARDVEKYQHVWGGEYERHSEARVFKNWKILEFDTPARAAFYHGGDWGFSVDPSVLIRSFVDGRTLYVDREAYEVGCEIDDTPALFDSLECGPECGCLVAGRASQSRTCTLATHGQARRWQIFADSARPETISYMRRHGYPLVRPARKGTGSVEEGIKFLQNYNIVVHPRCVHTIAELTHYSYEKDKLTDAVLPILQDKKNHVIDALRYAVEELRAKQGAAFGDLAGL